MFTFDDAFSDDASDDVLSIVFHLDEVLKDRWINSNMLFYSTLHAEAFHDYNLILTIYIHQSNQKMG